jgi:hypothetical protein
VRPQLAILAIRKYILQKAGSWKCPGTLLRPRHHDSAEIAEKLLLRKTSVCGRIRAHRRFKIYWLPSIKKLKRKASEIVNTNEST